MSARTTTPLLLKLPRYVARKTMAPFRRGVGLVRRLVAFTPRMVRAGNRVAGYARVLAIMLRHFLWFKLWGWRHVQAKLPKGDGPRRIVMLVRSQLNIDPRVEREARALAAGGFHVTVICPAWFADDAERPDIDWGENVTIQLPPQSAGWYVDEFPYLFGQQMLQAALEQEADAYHSHDLNTALPALLAAAQKRAACICDFHEWFSENVTWDSVQRKYRPHSWLKRTIYQCMERVAVRSSTAVITVCQSIGEHLEKRYSAPRPVQIIRNIPPLRSPATGTSEAQPTNLHETLGIASDQRIVLYQGGVGPSRNLEPVIAAFAHVRRAVLVIRGPGNEYYADFYRQLAQDVGAAERVYCLPPVHSSQVVAQARAADLGLWTLLANVGLNFKFSLPNKVFEYLAAGLPLIVADLPEVRRLIDRYQIGVCFEPDSPTSIAEAINRITEDGELYRSSCANIASALHDLQADREWDKLVQLYRGLMAKK